MAKMSKRPQAEEEAIRNAQADARLRLPGDLQERIALIFNYSMAKEAEKKAVAEAKQEAGAAAMLDTLVKKRGMEKDAISFIEKLRKQDTPLRARILAQVFGYADDFGWFLRDLFDADAVGVGSDDEAGETAGFDKTSEGKRRGGTQAQPRTTEEMAASHQPAPTPGVPLDEALKQLEAYRAANPPKRGRKAAELVRLEKQVEDAKTAAAEPAAEEAASAEIPDLPEAAPGEITQALREGNAEAEAHIAEQAAAEPKADKPKGRGRKKADAAETAPPPPPAEAGPSAPPAEDEEDDDFPGARLPGQPGTIGDQPSTFTMR